MEFIQFMVGGVLFGAKLFSLSLVIGAGLYFGVMLADRIGSRLP